MKNDLELLIDHIQNEYDYLKSELDDCVAEWDFEGAMAFREAIHHTKHKLIVLLSLQNSYYQKITSLESSIKKLEIVSKDIHNSHPLEGQGMALFIKDKTQQQKQELELLKSTKSVSRGDDDKILELFEMIENNEVHSLEFEIKKDKIKLTLKVIDDEAVLSLLATDKVHGGISSYFHDAPNKILKDLEWDISTYGKKIQNFKRYDKLMILEELAIIYFEIFNIFGEEKSITAE